MADLSGIALFELDEPWTLPKFYAPSHAGARADAPAEPLNAWDQSQQQTSWQAGYYDTRVKTSKQFEEWVTYYTHKIGTKGLARS